MVCGLARRWLISRSVLSRVRDNTDYPEAVVIPMPALNGCSVRAPGSV